MQSHRLHKKVDDKKQPTRYYSNRQESAIAAAVNGTKHKNSGATMFQKGDVVDDLFLYEAKTKTKDSKSFTIKKEWIDKNKNESLVMNKPYSAIVFNFGPNDDTNYYIIDEQTFILMKEVLDIIK